MCETMAAAAAAVTAAAAAAPQVRVSSGPKDPGEVFGKENCAPSQRYINHLSTPDGERL